MQLALDDSERIGDSLATAGCSASEIADAIYCNDLPLWPSFYRYMGSSLAFTSQLLS